MMTLLCWCGFHISDYFQWSDFWSLLGAAIGAFLGFLAASQIYKKEREDNQTDEMAFRRQQVETTMRLVAATGRNARRAGEMHQELLDDYEKERYGIHPRPIQINTTLITLDRSDRDELLLAFRRIAPNAALDLWDATWQLVDGLKQTQALNESAVLVNQKDLMNVAAQMGSECRQLLLMTSLAAAGATAITPASEAGRRELLALENKNEDAGFVTVGVMYDNLVIPLNQLIKDGVISYRDSYPLVETLSKAHAAYMRYGQIVDELKEGLLDCVKIFDDFAERGENLSGRIQVASNGNR